MKKKGSNDGAEPGDLVYYYLQGVNNTELYNDVLVRNTKEDGKSTSTADTFRVTGLPPEYVEDSVLSKGKLMDHWYRNASQMPSTLINAQIKEFTDLFTDNEETGVKPDIGKAWKHLLEEGDKLSVRERLLQQ